ncbi:MAG: UDP-N-acetylglucosamine 1-carboxyvinyltransferase [Pseudomonadota bacterium]
MDRIRIHGGRMLKGEVPIGGAKNAALPFLAASLLTSDPCRLTNVPHLKDVDTMCDVLKVLGGRIRRLDHEIEIRVEQLTGAEAPYDFVRKMRASVLLLGPLLARFGFARVSLPGGCAIGVRPIDQHLKAFQALGARIQLKDGYVEAEARQLVGTTYVFDQVTVTGTVNAMFAASLAEGETKLKNCACEPEVAASAELLAEMGAQVSGAGTPEVRIGGVKKLRGFNASLIPDRIETGTYMVASALTEGDLYLRNGRANDLQAVIGKLREIGAEVKTDTSGIRVIGHRPLLPTSIQTAPHPGFPTDMQAQLTVLLCLARGTSVVSETIFENRFMHVAELIRLGANLRVENASVTVVGVDRLAGAPVMATDLRASASLVLAGLAAEGTTEVLRIYHLDRGYENMDAKLRAVGADIERVHEGGRERAKE